LPGFLHQFRFGPGPAPAFLDGPVELIVVLPRGKDQQPRSPVRDRLSLPCSRRLLGRHPDLAQQFLVVLTADTPAEVTADPNVELPADPERVLTELVPELGRFLSPLVREEKECLDPQFLAVASEGHIARSARRGGSGFQRHREPVPGRQRGDLQLQGRMPPAFVSHVPAHLTAHHIQTRSAREHVVRTIS
jgi:hypothetical protein